MGWKTILSVDIPQKSVVCVAPHTSNWDFLYAKLYYSAIGGKPHFLMKKELFFFPMGYLIKAMGGIPVDRKNKKSLTAQMIEMFNSKKNFHLAVAPEGTRKKTSNWRTGFYYIAIGAKVPISLAHIDFRKKELGVSENFYPTGNEISDMDYIKKKYKDFIGKIPGNFSI
ncbi:acyltransferase [Bacteroidales bacterium]|nr:acyltransferase [Bacteroidales bacterium]